MNIKIVKVVSRASPIKQKLFNEEMPVLAPTTRFNYKIMKRVFKELDPQRQTSLSALRSKSISRLESTRRVTNTSHSRFTSDLKKIIPARNVSPVMQTIRINEKKQLAEPKDSIRIM